MKTKEDQEEEGRKEGRKEGESWRYMKGSGKIKV